MIRFLLWLVGGVLLGGIIHIVVILTLPMLAEETTWSRVSAFEDGRSSILFVIEPAVELRAVTQQEGVALRDCQEPTCGIGQGGL